MGAILAFIGGFHIVHHSKTTAIIKAADSMTHAKVVPVTAQQTSTVKRGQVGSIELFIVPNLHSKIGNFLPIH
jgi:hypothetical protein